MKKYFQDLPDWFIFKAIKDTFTAESNPHRILALDGLRGFAAILVVIEHTKAFGFEDIGRIGVYMFFVLSAFLLSEQLFRKGKDFFNPEDIRKYVVKRIKRIYPLFTTSILLSAILQFWPLEKILKNLFLIRGDGIYWAIQQEFLYYLVLPIIVYGLYKLTQNFSKELEFRVVAVTLIFMIIITTMFFTADVFGLETINRGDGSTIQYRRFIINVFLFGTLAAAVVKNNHLQKLFKENKVFSYVWDYVSLLLMGFLVLVDKSIIASVQERLNIDFETSVQTAIVNPWQDFWGVSGINFNLGYPYSAFSAFLVGLFIFIITINIIMNKQSVLRAVFEHWALRFFGTISFSLYLVHDPVSKYLIEFGYVLPGKGLFVIVLIIAALMSLVTYSFIERPFIIKD